VRYVQLDVWIIEKGISIRRLHGMVLIQVWLVAWIAIMFLFFCVVSWRRGISLIKGGVNALDLTKGLKVKKEFARWAKLVKADESISAKKKLPQAYGNSGFKMEQSQTGVVYF